MQKKLTISIEEKVYEGLHEVIGRRRISRFIEDLVRPHIMMLELESSYKQAAADQNGEAEALEWIEATVGDVRNEAR